MIVLNCYHEILETMGEPKWWDEHGVPRYVDFTPQETANIYASHVVLALITCQSCGHEFRVAFSQGDYEIMESARTLASYIQDRELHYGDPPNNNCCLAGPTMNSVPQRVLEYWSQDKQENGRRDWVRHPEFELEMVPDWATANQRLTPAQEADVETLLEGS